MLLSGRICVNFGHLLKILLFWLVRSHSKPNFVMFWVGFWVGFWVFWVGFGVFWVRQAKPLQPLEPGSVGAWLAVPKTTRKIQQKSPELK